MKLILVDSSFTSFYRFFATMRWYQLAHKDEFKKVKNDNKYDWLTNDVFREKYKKMYLQSIETVLKNMDDCILIFCMDAPQNTLWRHKLIKSKSDKDQYNPYQVA